MKRIQVFMQAHREIINFLFWGVMTTIVSWGTYSIVVTLTGSIITANLLSWIFAVLFAFITNKLWVFCSADWSLSVALPELEKFFAARLMTGFLEIVGVPCLVKAGINQQIFGIKGMAAKILVGIAVLILNYIFGKLLVFSKKR